MREMRNAYKICHKTQEEETTWKNWHRWKDNIKTDLKEI